jgi:L-iditol 2-dehydrogenase
MGSVQTDSIQALVLHGAKDLKFVSTPQHPCLTLLSCDQEDRPCPTPSLGEVQIQVKATGLCGSDLHYYNHGRNGKFVVQAPLCLGHESAGIVTAVPGDLEANGDLAQSQATAASLKVGDRVAMEVGLPCRKCDLCTSGRYNLCPTLRFKSSAKTFPHLDGTLQGVITHPADMCHKLPDNVSFEQGALVEPLAVCLHGITRSQTGEGVPLIGSTALVLGAGAVGMLTAAALAVSGVSKIVVADIDQPRLQIVESMSHGKFNFKTYLLPRLPRPSSDEEAFSNAEKLSQDVTKFAGLPAGFDRVFECTGVPSCVQLGCYAAATGGKLVLIGMGSSGMSLPTSTLALREVDMIGVFRYANCYPPAIALFASGQLDGVAEALVTHRVKLEDGERAFRLAANAAKAGEDEGRVPVKVMITS